MDVTICRIDRGSVHCVSSVNALVVKDGITGTVGGGPRFGAGVDPSTTGHSGDPTRRHPGPRLSDDGSQASPSREGVSALPERGLPGEGTWSSDRGKGRGVTGGWDDGSPSKSRIKTLGDLNDIYSAHPPFKPRRLSRRHPSCATGPPCRCRVGGSERLEH